ncbi:MAG: hypothetical protein WB579_06460, partial [Bryobacteraceae bacterium]
SGAVPDRSSSGYFGIGADSVPLSLRYLAAAIWPQDFSPLDAALIALCLLDVLPLLPKVPYWSRGSRTAALSRLNNCRLLVSLLSAVVGDQVVFDKIRSLLLSNGHLSTS